MADAGAVGTVRELVRYPLKSADGERLDAVAVTPDGLEDDRRWALRSASGEPVTAKDVPALRGVRARSVDGRLVVEPPGALADLAGPGVQVDDVPGGHQQVAAVHLASHGAVSAPDAPTGCDPEPRANLVLDLAEPGAERGWVGRRVRVGGALLEVTREPQRCLGVYCAVVEPGTVRVGDAVLLEG